MTSPRFIAGCEAAPNTQLGVQACWSTFPAALIGKHLDMPCRCRQGADVEMAAPNVVTVGSHWGRRLPGAGQTQRGRLLLWIVGVHLGKNRRQP